MSTNERPDNWITLSYAALRNGLRLSVARQRVIERGIEIRNNRIREADAIKLV